MQANRVNPEIDSNFGTEIVLRAEQLAGHSDDPSSLSLAYLTRAHQTAGAEIAGWMIEAGMQVRIDAVGNVIGRYAAAGPQAPILMTGSHFDTVRAGGRFDGRLGILAPIVVVAHLHRRGERLPFHLDVVPAAHPVRCDAAPGSTDADVGEHRRERRDGRGGRGAAQPLAGL